MEHRDIIFLNSLAFVIGFVMVFSVLGVLIQTVLSNVASGTLNILRLVGGAVIVFFGVSMLISTRYAVPFLSSEHRIRPRRFQNSYLTSFVFGLSFALGWTPCVGAVLGTIYTLAAVYPDVGFLLLFTYSLGIGVPFLLIGSLASRATALIGKLGKFLKYFNVFSGLLLVLVGILVLTNYIGILAIPLEGMGISIGVTGKINFFVAYAAGVLTFLSPCILPLVPAYLSFMAGTAVEEVKRGKKQ